MNVTQVAKQARTMARSNMGALITNWGYYHLQHFQSVTNNAFIASACLQSFLRITETSKNAAAARNTPDEQLRLKEAAKTVIREVLGITFSYLVLRSMSMGVKKAIIKHFKITFDPVSEHAPKFFDTVKKLGSNVRNWFSGSVPSETIRKMAASDINDLYHYKNITAENLGRSLKDSWLAKPVEWFASLDHFFTKNQLTTDAAKIQNFLDWAPTAISSIPAILMSGFWLERFSQTGAEKLSERIAGNIGSRWDRQEELAKQQSPALAPNPQFGYAQPNGFPPAQQLMGQPFAATPPPPMVPTPYGYPYPAS